MSGEDNSNQPLRMHIALQIMRAWNHGSEGYDAIVAHTINEWIDGGMNGPVPWPESPLFAEWADRKGYAVVRQNGGSYVGFSLQLIQQ